MEIKKKNRGEYLGFKNGESAIFINESNYKEKFEEYFSDPKNSKWEEIATQGKNHAINNLSNDRAVESLVELIKEIV